MPSKIIVILIVLMFLSVNIDYFIESVPYGFLFTSCKTLENERVSVANEWVFRRFVTSV